MESFCNFVDFKPKKKLSFSQHNKQANNQSQQTQSPATAGLQISPVDEQFISQIVLTPTPIEQPLANVLSSVFGAGRSEQFISTLQTWAARKEEEIEASCAEGYGLFVPAVEAILGRVRENASVLDQRVCTLKSEISSSAQQIYDTRIERFEARKMLLNVGKAIRALDDSLQALNLLQRINLDISDGAYQEAVKLIDELQGKGLLRAIEEMPFCKQIEAAVEVSKKRVWDAASGKVKSWLVTVREDTILMGNLALSQLQTRYEQFERSSHNSTEISRGFQLFLAETAAEDAAVITCNDMFKIDFTPLQDVWRLFSLMDRQGELAALLIENRRVQLELILGGRVGMERADSDPKSFRSFLNALVGFFIFDRQLARLPLGIYPFGQVELRWEEAQVRLREIAMESLKLSASDRAAFMKIKWQLVFFTHCTDMFGFPANPLVETIFALFYRYVDLLRQDTIERCQMAILRDLFTSTCPENAEMLRVLPQLTGKSVDFSASLWECVACIQSFMNSFKVFLEGVPGVEGRRADFADLSRKTVDDHILSGVAKAFTERLYDEALTDPGQKMQVLYDLDCFKRMCSAGGDLVKIVTQIYDRNDLFLNSKNTFNAAFEASQQILLHSCIEGIDPLLQKLNYDRNPPSKITSPSPVIQDLIRLLKRIQGETLIDDSGMDSFWCSLLQHICAYFDSKILADVKYPHCNSVFFQNLAVDLEALKAFCLQLSATPQIFVDCIAQPLELCSLMAAESVHEFLDPVVRKRKYSHIETGQLLTVLQRVKEPAEKRQSVEDLILLLK